MISVLLQAYIAITNIHALVYRLSTWLCNLNKSPSVPMKKTSLKSYMPVHWSPSTLTTGCPFFYPLTGNTRFFPAFQIVMNLTGAIKTRCLILFTSPVSRFLVVADWCISKFTSSSKFQSVLLSRSVKLESTFT